MNYWNVSKLQDFIEFREKVTSVGKSVEKMEEVAEVWAKSSQKLYKNAQIMTFHDSCLQSSCEVSSSSGHVEVTYCDGSSGAPSRKNVKGGRSGM